MLVNRIALLCGVLLLNLLCSSLSFGHESRPGFLLIEQQSTYDSLFDITWRRPAKGLKVLSMQPEFPECIELPGRVQYRQPSALVETWQIQCGETGVRDQEIFIHGLQNTLTDVVVKVALLEGWQHTQIIKPNQPSFVVPQQPSQWRVAADYTVLGVEHILGGIDHLLFVFALLFVVSSRQSLIWTITAFTLAHSVTLVLATLQMIQVPGAPVEAFIALSIVFLAKEMLLKQKGHTTAAIQWPWAVAFVFGLVHGLGFAGALEEVGLPQQDIPLALLTFNVGVELGQLLFVATMLIIGKVAQLIWRQLITRPFPVQHWVTTSSYSIGVIASIWLFERVAGF